MEVYEYLGYCCGFCFFGLQGNGIYCSDINECVYVDFCFLGFSCINIMFGFYCEVCF